MEKRVPSLLCAPEAANAKTGRENGEMPVAKIAEGRTLLKKFVIYELTGVVQSETTRSETEVTGQIYGGGTASAYGGTNPVQGSIKSKTTRYQTVYLKDDGDSEHAAELVDLVVPCREGHRITLWRLGPNRWIKALNDGTNGHPGRALADDVAKGSRRRAGDLPGSGLPGA